MIKSFGTRLRSLRESRKMTREDFCGDESRLSVRQLARIESNQCTPTLERIQYMADRLGVTISSLVNENQFQLSSRYKELKHQILMIPTYGDNQKLLQREQWLDEVITYYYDYLPEEEQLVIDCLQSTFEIQRNQNIAYGISLLEEYLEQVKRKDAFQFNDLIIIDLYLTCTLVSAFKFELYDARWNKKLARILSEKSRSFRGQETYFLSHILLNCIDVLYKEKEFEFIEESLESCKTMMSETQDYKKLPVVCLLEWKYSLFHLQDSERAKCSYKKALSYTQLANDMALEEKLREEWRKDALSK